MAMSVVREIRKRSGLSQAELARRAHTSRTRLSAYENERTSPELETLERLAAAADLEIALAPKGTARVRDQIASIAACAHEGRTEDGVRLVAELVAWTQDGVIEIESLRPEPASTGDVRWDALIAGVAEMLFFRAKRNVPGWTSSPGRILDRPWFVTKLTSLRPEVFTTTPAPLAARGVMLSARALESV